MAPKTRVRYPGKKGSGRKLNTVARDILESTIMKQRIMEPGFMLRSHTGTGFVDSSLQNLTFNFGCLKPVTKFMAEHGLTKIHSVDALGALFWKCYCLAGREVTPANKRLAHQDAWAAKRLLGVIRRKWQREEFPRDTRLNLLMICYGMYVCMYVCMFVCMYVCTCVCTCV
jgi:hypothetical protein